MSLTKILPTSQLPPDNPATYVDACSNPPKCPELVPLASLLSKDLSAPAPLSMALYPPPEKAIATLGSAVVFFALFVMYALALKPEIFNLPSLSKYRS